MFQISNCKHARIKKMPVSQLVSYSVLYRKGFEQGVARFTFTALYMQKKIKQKRTLWIITHKVCLVPVDCLHTFQLSVTDRSCAALFRGIPRQRLAASDVSLAASLEASWSGEAASLLFYACLCRRHKASDRWQVSHNSSSPVFLLNVGRHNIQRCVNSS